MPVPLRIVSSWLQYVYAGRVEWQSEDTDKIRKLAEQFGPDDLIPLCARMKPPKGTELFTGPISGVDPSSNFNPAVPEVATKESSGESEITPDISSTPSLESEVIVPEILKVELEEPGISTNTANNSIDSEDPLQGLQLADSSIDSTTDVECITIEDIDITKMDDPKQAALTTSDNDVLSNHSHEPVKLTEEDNAATHEKEDEHCQKTPSARETVDDMQITLFDIPENLNTPGPSRASKSPDLFDEKSKAAEDAVEDFSWNFTPLRTQTAAGSNRGSSLQATSSAKKHLRLSHNENGESDPAHNLNGDDSQEKVEPLPRPDSVESDDVVCLEDHSNLCFLVSQSVRDAEEEPMKNYRCSKSPTGERKVTSRRKSQSSSATEDSFFDTPKFVIPLTESLESKEMNENPITLDGSSPNFILPVAQSTPAEPARKKARFGSNVKVLKTSEITPMPNYEGMADEELKSELTKFGLKPMGRKRAINMLKRIYDEVHPGKVQWLADIDYIDTTFHSDRPLHTSRAAATD
ncbi:unnamed protein product [Strongylus vulgaris]|uniref:BTB domain-containing protein n=1 Tax=Strongylus vulgaris TaxID=40348 RepID=A0A3P7JLI4_STRVU|nr:unnamed protein product [Strongylus vulgaris]